MPNLQDWSDFQNDLMTNYQTLFGFQTPLYAELTGATVSPEGIATHDPSQERVTPLSKAGRDTFLGGAEIRIPIQVADVAGASAVGRAGTWPVTSPIETAKATLKLAEMVQPIGVDLATERDARNGVYTARDYVETLTESGYRSLARLENDMLHGAGDALLAKNTNGDATGLVMTVGTGANFDQLTPGRVVDVLKVADGSDPGEGKRRKIASVDRTAGTVTFSAAQVASDGGTGNIALAAAAAGTWGIYLDSSHGNAMQGLGQCVTAAGTPFEGIDVADVASWSACSTDGGNAALDDSAFEDAVYQLSGYGIDAPDFAIAHTKVVDPYKNTKTQYLMIEPQTRVVPSGFAGVVVQVANRDFPLIKDLAAPHGKCRVVVKSALRIYGDSVGPEFIQDDGGMWRFFNRQSYKEATILDRAQLAVKNPAHLAEIKNVTG